MNVEYDVKRLADIVDTMLSYLIGNTPEECIHVLQECKDEMENLKHQWYGNGI